MSYDGWVVLGRGSPWSLGGETSWAAPTSRNSRLRRAPDGYTPSWRPKSVPLEPPPGIGRGGSRRTARRPPWRRACRIGRIPSRASLRHVIGTRTRSRPPGIAIPPQCGFPLGAGRPVGPGGWGASPRGGRHRWSVRHGRRLDLWEYFEAGLDSRQRFAGPPLGPSCVNASPGEEPARHRRSLVNGAPAHAPSPGPSGRGGHEVIRRQRRPKRNVTFNGLALSENPLAPARARGLEGGRAMTDRAAGGHREGPRRRRDSVLTW